VSADWSIATAIKDAADALRVMAAPPVAIVLDPVDYRRFLDEIADESMFSGPGELVVGGTLDAALASGQVQFYGLSVRAE
jgi:hypothetical protein